MIVIVFLTMIIRYISKNTVMVRFRGLFFDFLLVIGFVWDFVIGVEFSVVGGEFAFGEVAKNKRKGGRGLQRILKDLYREFNKKL